MVSITFQSRAIRRTMNVPTVVFVTRAPELVTASIRMVISTLDLMVMVALETEETAAMQLLL
jgi:hypothetical protein